MCVTSYRISSASLQCDACGLDNRSHCLAALYDGEVAAPRLASDGDYVRLLVTDELPQLLQLLFLVLLVRRQVRVLSFHDVRQTEEIHHLSLHVQNAGVPGHVPES